MTNSFDLSPNPRPNLIIIHGLNNNDDAFHNFTDEFEQLGWNTHFLRLPGHDAQRLEIKDLKMAMDDFHQKILPFTKKPFLVLAYSFGALYFQLWAKTHPEYSPQGQVLLAPAFHIYKEKSLSILLKLLPDTFRLKSFSPKRFRQNEFLKISDYKILFEALNLYNRTVQIPMSPTLIVIDPKDELVNAKAIQRSLSERKDQIVEFELWKRPNLNMGLGQHHILFHPEYFSHLEWREFILKIHTFLMKRSNLKV